MTVAGAVADPGMESEGCGVAKGWCGDFCGHVSNKYILK